MSPGNPDRQKPKREFKILVFSDIFVFMDANEMKKKGKKDYTKWPCELLWIKVTQSNVEKQPPTNLLEVIGPWKRLVFNCVTAEALELWKQTFIQVIEARVKTTQSQLGSC